MGNRFGCLGMIVLAVMVISLAIGAYGFISNGYSTACKAPNQLYNFGGSQMCCSTNPATTGMCN